MKKHVGSLEVITGSMFSGKSEELIRRLRRAKYAKQKMLVFSPTIDDRYGVNGIYSHNKNNVSAYSVKDVNEMTKILYENPDTEVIGIDEIQFFEKNVVDFCKKCIELGKRVIVAGLDLDFKGVPFQPLPELMAIADEVEKLSAICTVCGNKAYASQRLIDGKPAYDDDPLVAVGSDEKYEARCRMHHIVRKRTVNPNLIEFVVQLDSDSKKIENIKSLSGYNIVKLDISKKVKEIRENILKLHGEDRKIAILIPHSISSRIEGKYEVLDLMAEFVKCSNINILSDDKFENLITTCSLIRKCELNIKNIYLTCDNKTDVEKIKKNIGIIPIFI
ncbi:thymidine kinase [uncultured Sneathia sp.]|uniref:thymidine kinase n=1 Tax=uncultured Sneathia sp. TaxID=278067 RepID=UPI00259BB003|nr:thymidine kinase [uncultured Sneathia sp.]